MGAGGGRRSAVLGRIPPDRGLGTSRSGRARCCIACAARSGAIRGVLMNRRDFVVSLSAAAGVLGWRSRRSSAARIRFGYAAITWNGNDRQAIDDIAAIGFRGIQLRQSAFDTWADRPAERGMPLGYHHHRGALGQSPEEVARVLDATDPRFVHLLLDTAHYQQAGGDPAVAVRQHAGRLLFLHIKDLAGNRFVELGRGSVDLHAVFAALDAIKFDGWGVVELDSVTDPAETPKESGVIARRYLEAMQRWNDAS